MPLVRWIGDRIYVTLGGVEHGMSEVEAEMLFLALGRHFHPSDMIAWFPSAAARFRGRLETEGWEVTEKTTPPPRLDTGEEIRLRPRPPAEDHLWEAVADVRVMHGTVDCHALGATPDEAVERLRDFVAGWRRRAGK